jgi:hypothetical protein
MDEIGPRREERLRELARDFMPVFGNGEDADLAATMLVMALASPIIEEDRPRYLACAGTAPQRQCCRAESVACESSQRWRRAAMVRDVRRPSR